MYKISDEYLKVIVEAASVNIGWELLEKLAKADSTDVRFIYKEDDNLKRLALAAVNCGLYGNLTITDAESAIDTLSICNLLRLATKANELNFSHFITNKVSP